MGGDHSINKASHHHKSRQQPDQGSLLVCEIQDLGYKPIHPVGFCFRIRMPYFVSPYSYCYSADLPGFGTGVKEAAQGRPFSLRVPRRKKTPGSRSPCPGGREINSVYYFSDGEIKKKGARLTPIDGQGVPNAPRSCQFSSGDDGLRGGRAWLIPSR